MSLGSGLEASMLISIVISGGSSVASLSVLKHYILTTPLSLFIR